MLMTRSKKMNNNMKHLTQHIQESLFDKDIIDKSPSILGEITIKFFEKMMNATTVDEWDDYIIGLKKYLNKTKIDNISFDEYTNKEIYKNGVMTIVPLIDMSSIVICYKSKNGYRLFELRVGRVGSKIFPDCYFWGLSIPSSRMLPDYLFKELKKTSSHNIYKITFSEFDIEMFQNTVRRKR